MYVAGNTSSLQYLPDIQLHLPEVSNVVSRVLTEPTRRVRGGGAVKIAGAELYYVCFVSFSVALDVIKQCCVVLKSLATRGSLLCGSLLFPLPVRLCWEGGSGNIFHRAPSGCRRPVCYYVRYHEVT
jgi:hypothetical protein